MCKMKKIAICMVTLMMMTGLAACSADNNTDSNVNSVTDESGNSSNSDNGKNTDNSLEKDMDHLDVTTRSIYVIKYFRHGKIICHTPGRCSYNK